MAFKIRQNPLSVGAVPEPCRLRELTTLPQTSYSRLENGHPPHNLPHSAPTHLRRSPCIPRIPIRSTPMRTGGGVQQTNILDGPEHWSKAIPNMYEQSYRDRITHSSLINVTAYQSTCKRGTCTQARSLSCDLDLDPMTLLYELDLDILPKGIPPYQK